MVYQDDAAFIRDMLKDNWINANTDEVKPEIIKIIDTKRQRFAQDNDTIAIYNVNTNFKDEGMGDKYRFKTYRTSTDIYTVSSSARLYKIVKEVIRIFNTYSVIKGTFTLNSNTYSYDGILKVDNIKEHSNKSVGLFRQTIDTIIEDDDLKG